MAESRRSAKSLRCAIYTRVSTDSGLDQEFNSLDAQYDAASAYIRSLAQMRGRNAEWAEQAVRQAVSLPAADALKLKVIDLVAADLPALLRQLDGRRVNVLGVERTLQLKLQQQRVGQQREKESDGRSRA